MVEDEERNYRLTQHYPDFIFDTKKKEEKRNIDNPWIILIISAEI